VFQNANQDVADLHSLKHKTTCWETLCWSIDYE